MEEDYEFEQIEEEEEEASDSVEAAIKQSDALEIKKMDASKLSICLTDLSRKMAVNINLREKYTFEQDKFLESEIELFDELRILQQINAYPDLLPSFIGSQGLQILVDLLNHPNCDIIYKVVELLSEMTEGDYLAESEKPEIFLELILQVNLLEMVAGLLRKVKEDDSKEYEQFCTDCLSIFENIIEIFPKAHNQISKIESLSLYLIDKLSEYSNDFNTHFCSELLYSLVQECDAFRFKLARSAFLQVGLNILLVIV